MSLKDRIRSAGQVVDQRLTHSLLINSHQGDQWDAQGLARSWLKGYLENEGQSPFSETEQMETGLRWFREARSEKEKVDELRADLPKLGLRAFVKALFGL